MDPNAMEPHGLALIAYFEGDASAQLIIRRDDGLEIPLPVGHFFRHPDEFSSIENDALARCSGRVLDVGAGTGLHSMVLRDRGCDVTAIDISPQAVEIMRRRGLADVQCADIFDYEGRRFDTLLMLGHGIGIVQDLKGLSSFLTHARRLIAYGGQLLLDSHDVHRTDDPTHLAYHEANRRAQRYAGETRLRFEFRGRAGPYCGWLHVDPATLAERAGSAGWECEVILDQEGGDYLARLTGR